MKEPDMTAENFVLEAAKRANLSDLEQIGMFAQAKWVIEICATVADAGGGHQQMVEQMAGKLENVSTTKCAFASLLVNYCVDFMERRGSNGKQPAGVGLRRHFAFLKNFDSEEELEQELWSYQNPYAFLADLTGAEHLSKAQATDAIDRFEKALLAHFGDNNKVVEAYSNVFEADRPTAAAKTVWNDAIAKAKTVAMDGLPDAPTVRFRVMTYTTM